jgi:hypothetical protein
LKEQHILEKIEEKIAQRSLSSNTYDGRRMLANRNKQSDTSKLGILKHHNKSREENTQAKNFKIQN